MMNKFLLFFLLLIGLIGSGISQVPPSYTRCVGTIKFKDWSTGGFSIGTASLIAKFDSADIGRIFLVTNLHVLPSPNQNQSIIFSIGLPEKDSILSVNVPIYNDKGDFLPTVKRGGNEDLVVIEFTHLFNKHGFFEQEVRVLKYSDLLSKDSLSIMLVGQGDDVFFIGFPAWLYDKRNSSPIVRSGVISSNPAKDYYFSDEFRGVFRFRYGETTAERLNGFLIDANAIGGSSGSLVFLKQKAAFFTATGHHHAVPEGAGHPWILGILQTSLITLDRRKVDYTDINIGGVISSDVIKSTIDLFY